MFNVVLARLFVKYQNRVSEGTFSVFESRCTCYLSNTYGRILKANLSWSSTRAKFDQLIASLSMVPLQLNLTKLELENLKSGFKCKRESTQTKKICITGVRLFSSSAQVWF